MKESVLSYKDKGTDEWKARDKRLMESFPADLPMELIPSVRAWNILVRHGIFDLTKIPVNPARLDGVGPDTASELGSLRGWALSQPWKGWRL